MSVLGNLMGATFSQCMLRTFGDVIFRGWNISWLGLGVKHVFVQYVVYSALFTLENE